MKDIWDRYYGMMDLDLLFLPLSSTSCWTAPLGCQSSAKITQEATPEGEERSDEASQAWCQVAMPPLPSFSLCFFFLLPVGNLMSTSSCQSEVAATVSGQRAKVLFRKWLLVHGVIPNCSSGNFSHLSEDQLEPYRWTWALIYLCQQFLEPAK